MDSTHAEYWKKTLSTVRNSGYFDNGTMTWIEKTQLFKIENGQAFISYRSVITSNLLQEHLELFEDTLSELWGSRLKLVLISQKDMEEMMPEEALKQKTAQMISRGFDPAYTFDSFVMGPSNREALMACMNIVHPMRGMPSINPLLIYGNSGLGKTHILNAVGNELKATSPRARVTYLYAGDLVSLLLEAMRTQKGQTNSVEAIKAQLLDCDYFLIDDIQNLRAPSCQDVFFTIYNELIARKIQIIITSDTHPSEISILAQRLISRFSSGLIVNIAKPEAETAVAILKKKIAGMEDAFDVDDEVLEFLALRYSDDVRALEGILNRLIFNATIFKPERVSMDFAMTVLKDEPYFKPQEEINARSVKKAVTQFYGLSYQDLEGKSRQKKISQARQICIYLMREMCEMSYAAIGQEMGGRDHTTISSSCSKARSKIKSDKAWKEACEAVKKKLTG